MNKLKYVTDIFLDEFSTNFKHKYLGLYLNNDADEIKEIFSNPQISGSPHLNLNFRT